MLSNGSMKIQSGYRSIVEQSGVSSVLSILSSVATQAIHINIPRLIASNSGLFDAFIKGGIGATGLGVYLSQAVVKDEERVRRKRKKKDMVYHYTDKYAAMKISFGRSIQHNQVELLEELMQQI